MSRLLGVNVEPRAMSLSVVERRPGRVRHLSDSRIALPETGDERDRAIVEALAGVQKQFAVQEMVIGVPLRHLSFSLLEMPALTQSDMRRALSFELEKHLPLSVDEYVFDYVARPTVVEGERKELTQVCAMRRIHLDEYLRPFRQSAIPIRCVTPAACGTLASLLSVAGAKDGAGLVVYSSEDEYEALGLEGSFPTEVRRLRRGDAAAGDLEAFADRHSGSVIVSGNIPAGLFSRRTVSRLNVNLSSLLAEGAAKGRMLSMNLLPEDLRIPKRDYYPAVVWALGSVCAVLFLTTGLTAYLKDRMALAAVRDRLGTIRQQAAPVLDARRDHDRVLSDRKVLADFLVRRGRTVKALDRLSRAIPPSAWLVSLSIDEKGKIEMEGVAQKTGDVVAALEKDGTFGAIGFTMPITYKPGEERFALRMEITE